MQFLILWSGYVKDFKHAQIPPVLRLCKCGTVLPARRYVCDKCKTRRNKHAWTWRKKKHGR